MPPVEDPSAPPALPPALAERYAPLGRLGRGGSSEVVLAEDRRSGDRVAVKLLRVAATREARERFAREAGALQALRHAHILGVREHGVAGRVPYLVTPWIDGRPLSSRPPGLDALAVMVQVAGALDAVHGAGLVHRDVKPSNILVTRAGRAVLADFGLVWAPGWDRLTADGWVQGTAGFTAPEVLASERSSRRADWFAWGATLFWLLEGRLPYRSKEILAAAAGRPLPALEFRRLDPGSRAAGLLRSALAADPVDRPASRGTVERQLRRELASESGAWSAVLPELPRATQWARAYSWLQAALLLR